MVSKTMIPGFRESEPVAAETGRMISNFSPYVRQSGNEWRPPWRIKSRKLLDYLLVLIATGEGVFTVADTTFPVKSGDLVLIPPDTLHEMRGTSGRMHCIYLHFDLIYDAARSHWDACIPGGTRDLTAFREFMHPVITAPFWKDLKGKLPLADTSVIKTLMIRICSLHTNCRAVNAPRLSGIMLELLAKIRSRIIAGENKQLLHYDRLTAAAAYLAGHPEAPVNIKRMAEQAGLSTSHFRKLFRRIYGISPKAMQLQSRLEKACELLTYWNMNVSETAEQLKFSSVYSFSRAFKNIAGLSPLQYLRKNRDENPLPQ
ncbi:MAG: AraC family transcriptional regulator [Victivallaceae bacterium]|nr:AraC family transcriptional regulator [Victivallaceae bacterium]